MINTDAARQLSRDIKEIFKRLDDLETNPVSVTGGVVPAPVAQGDILHADAVPAWAILSIGTSHQLAKVNAAGNDIVYESFDWDTISAAAAADMVHDHSSAAEGGLLPVSSIPAHASTHENAGVDEINVAGLSGELADAQPVAVSRNSGAIIGTRSELNFVEGANISLTIADDAGNDEVDITIAATGLVAAHTILDGSVHTDSALDAVTRGSLIVGNSTPLWDELVIGGAATFLRSDGTDPSWAAIVAGDLPAHTHSGAGQGGALVVGTTDTDATPGSVLFAGVGGVIQEDNSNLFWDDTNNALGIRSNAPAASAEALYVPWVAGDATTTAYFGSGNISNDQNAVTGESYRGDGVYGTAAHSAGAGVRGVGTSIAPGVIGTSVANVGVYGISTSSIGVVAESATGSEALRVNLTGAGTWIATFQDNGTSVWGIQNGGNLLAGSAGTLDLNGNADALIFDNDGDTTISAPTPNQLDMECGGVDCLVLTSVRLAVTQEIGHIGDTDTLHEFPAPDQWRLACGGVEMISAVEGANDYINLFPNEGGNVGIGVSGMPDELLTVYHSTDHAVILLEAVAANKDPQIHLSHNSDPKWAILSDTSDSDKFLIYDFNAVAARLVIDTSGNVGVGVSPSTRLDIDAGAMEFAEMTAPAAGAANTARLFARDNGAGKTQLCVRFNTGAIQVLATEP